MNEKMFDELLLELESWKLGKQFELHEEWSMITKEFIEQICSMYGLTREQLFGK